MFMSKSIWLPMSKFEGRNVDLTFVDFWLENVENVDQCQMPMQIAEDNGNPVFTMSKLKSKNIDRTDTRWFLTSV